LLRGEQAWCAGELGELAGIIGRLTRMGSEQSSRNHESRLLLLGARFYLVRRQPASAAELAKAAWLAVGEAESALRSRAIGLCAHALATRRRLAEALALAKPAAILANASRVVVEVAPLAYVVAALLLAGGHLTSARRHQRTFARKPELRKHPWHEALNQLLLSEEAWRRGESAGAERHAAKARRSWPPQAPFMLRCATAYQTLKAYCLAQQWSRAACCLEEIQREFWAVQFLRLSTAAKAIRRRRLLINDFQPLAIFPCW